MTRALALLLAVVLAVLAPPASAQLHVSLNESASLGGDRGLVESGWSPAWLAPAIVVYLRPDLGATTAIGPVTATGTTPPTVTISGTPTSIQTSYTTPYVELDCTTPGILGTSKFTVKLNGSTTATNVASASSGVVLTGSGLTAGWAAGASATNDVYTANIIASALADQSGAGNGATQATASLQPTYLGAGGGGIGAQACLASNPAFTSYLNMGAAANVIVATTAGERVIVAQNANDPPSGGATGLAETNWGSAATNSNLPYTDGKIYDEFGISVRLNFTHAASLASPFLYDSTASQTTGLFLAFLDGTQINSTAKSWGMSSSTPKIMGGSDNKTIWCEWIVVNRQLYGVERAALNAYATNRYGANL